MNPNALLLLYEKHNRELRQVRNYIRGRKQKNEFEEMFMRQFAGFLKRHKLSQSSYKIWRFVRS